MPTTIDDFELSELISKTRAAELAGVRRETLVRWSTEGRKSRATGQRVKLRTVGRRTTVRWVKEFLISTGTTGDEISRGPTVLQRNKQKEAARQVLLRAGIIRPDGPLSAGPGTRSDLRLRPVPAEG